LNFCDGVVVVVGVGVGVRVGVRVGFRVGVGDILIIIN